MLGKLLLTILIGAAGSWILYKMKLPAGAMVGAIISVGVFQILTGYAYFPKIIKVAVQAIAGAFVGQRIGRSDLKELRTIVKPSLQLFFGIVCLSLCTSLLIHHTTSVDMATSLLSSVPGGMSDVALMSADVGANPAQSTALQLVRYLLAILILPQMDTYLCRRFAPEAVGHGHNAARAPEKLQDKKHLAITLVIVTISAAVGKLSGFPAGAMIFPMFATAAYNVRSEQAYLPKPMKVAAQCFAGINVGVTITLQDILQFRSLLLPAIFVAINCILTNYVLGLLIHKTNDLDLATSLFASVPAGLSDMALVSLELGGDAPKVAVLQLVRYMCVMTFMPLFIKLFAAWYPF